MGAAVAPKAFMCTFTDEPLIDPVVTCDGHTYSRAPIEHWFRQNPLQPHIAKDQRRAEQHCLGAQCHSATGHGRNTRTAAVALDPDLISMNDPEELLGEGSYGHWR